MDLFLQDILAPAAPQLAAKVAWKDQQATRNLNRASSRSFFTRFRTCFTVFDSKSFMQHLLVYLLR